MKNTIYTSVEEALALYRILIEKFGGDFGVRDLGLLESALLRPRSSYYQSLSTQAAALLHSLLLNHCFVDGNKRLAFTLTATFLKINGIDFQVSADEAEEFIVEQIIKNQADASAIASWIEKHSSLGS